MQEVLTSTKSNNVRLYVVWLPVLRSDDRESAVERTKEFSDSRINYYWDEEGITGTAWQKSLKIKSFAWDVYLIYEPQAKPLTDQPEQPYFWMHQLRSVESAPFLKKDEFELKMRQLLRTKEKPQ
ncbi:MAG TPA: hypothetical protein VLH08_19715 [Acidobacteriota bacterium]|nr:hypothetical protein [Acidobacteriota bacterium]